MLVETQIFDLGAAGGAATGTGVIKSANELVSQTVAGRGLLKKQAPM
jgi:hypothetical protein